MKVKLSKHRGFCFGVSRGVALAEKTLSSHKNINVYSIGPLIHNPQVVKQLAKKGLKVIENLKGIKKGIVIISCHGTSPVVLENIKKNRLKLVDATCPFVKRPQLIARSLEESGYLVIIVGDKKHSEVRSLLSFAKNKAIVVSSEEEASRLRIKNKKIGIIAQTTQSEEIFNKIVSIILKNKGFEVRIFNTICDDAAKRQEKAKRLAKQVDVMLVIGGKASANTKRLAMVCKNACNNVYHIETSHQLKPKWCKYKSSVGITSGASTPDWVVDEVVKKIKKEGE